jgi:predicted TIM-barrel fold metal-dependent hydrolase
LIACDTLLGAPRVPFSSYTPDVTDLQAEMTRLRIDAAIVRHRACLETAPYLGNDILMGEISGHAGLIPAWFVTPDGREPDWSAARLVEQMAQAGVRFAWTDPEAEMMSLQPWCSGKLYAALQERRMPLLLPYNKIKMDDLHMVLQAYPQLPVILFNVLRVGRNRFLEPLLEQHANLYLCFGPTFSVHNYFRDLCHRFGPQRWVWGSAYPEYEGGAGIAGLTYAGLTEDEMALVGHGNIERLLAEVET